MHDKNVRTKKINVNKEKNSDMKSWMITEVIYFQNKTI